MPAAEAGVLLPVWVRWAPLLFHLPAAALLAAFCTWLGLRAAALRLPARPDTHWTERARQVYPLRLTAACLAAVLPILCAGWASQHAGPLFALSGRPLVALVGLASYAGGFVVSRRSEQHILGRRSTLRASLRGLASAYLLLWSVVPVTVGLCLAMPSTLGPRALATLAGGLALQVALFAGGALALARRLGLAGPPREELRAAVESAAHRMGVPVPPTLEFESPLAVAVAFTTSGHLGFSTAAAELLSAEELRGVTLHELAHLGEPRHVAWVRVAGACSLVLLGAGPALGGTWGAWAVLPLLAAVLLTLRLLLRLTLSHEKAADAKALAHLDDDRAAYARALERLYEFNLIPASARQGQASHPDLHDRMKEAGVEPAYPKPAPPSSRRFLAGYLVGLAPALLLAALLLIVQVRQPGTDVALAVTGGSARELVQLAYESFDSEDLEGAARLYGLAALADAGPESLAGLAIVRVWQERCGEAYAALAEAERRPAARRRDREALSRAREAVAGCARH